MEKLSAPGANRGSTAPPTSRIPPVAGFAHRRCHLLVMMAGRGGHDILDADEGDEEVRRAGVVVVEVVDALIERILLLVTLWRGRSRSRKSWPSLSSTTANAVAAPCHTP